MQILPVRLLPGDDLRRALESAVHASGMTAAFVLSGIGSLRPAAIRLAGADDAITMDSDSELLALLPDCHFSREPDPLTGWAELVIGRRTDA